MIPELGHAALVVGLMISLAQSFVPLLGASKSHLGMMRVGDTAAKAQALLVALSFGCLVYSFVVSDFSVAVVATNSHTVKPMLYKVTATWGNHEGSILLWSLVLALFGALIAVNSAIPSQLRARILSVQGMVGAGFLAFIIFTSNPFERLYPVPLQGNGLNPLLEDLGLAFHPPFLYLGYVGFSTAFSFAAAALIEGRADSDWARLARPWILAAWALLTIGIAGGSFWAYYELGWGGWWAWDPVENASLMPWLLGTALLHSILVVERRRAFVKWTLLLGILTFAMSLVGTFVVRSGVLSSVHAFAQDPDRGVFILGILVAAIGGSLTLYAWRSSELEIGEGFDFVSRESSLLVNNVLLVTALATVFIGTFYPLFIDLMGTDKISVGAPYYAITFVPLVVPLIALMAVGPLIKWRSDDIRETAKRLRLPLISAGVAGLVCAFAGGSDKPMGIVGISLGTWVVLGSLAILARRVRAGEIPILASLHLAMSLPRASYGVVVSHLGMGFLILGVTGASVWVEESVIAMRTGETSNFAGYDITLNDVREASGPDFQAQRASFALRRSEGGSSVTLSPEQRFHIARQMMTTEAAIQSGIWGNFYISIGETDAAGRTTVRMFYHPLALWIWIGALAMAAGGALSLSSGRLFGWMRRPMGVRFRSLTADTGSAG